MDRCFTANPEDGNRAFAYTVFDDGRLSEIGLPSLQGGDAFDGSGSLRSCVNDVVTWCKVLIEALKLQLPRTSSSQLPLFHS